MVSTIFQLYRGNQFYWSTRRKPPTCRKLLTMLYRIHLAMTVIRTDDVSGDDNH